MQIWRVKVLLVEETWIFPLTWILSPLLTAPGCHMGSHSALDFPQSHAGGGSPDPPLVHREERRKASECRRSTYPVIAATWWLYAHSVWTCFVKALSSLHWNFCHSLSFSLLKSAYIPSRPHLHPGEPVTVPPNVVSVAVLFSLWW